MLELTPFLKTLGASLPTISNIEYSKISNIDDFSIDHDMVSDKVKQYLKLATDMVLCFSLEDRVFLIDTNTINKIAYRYALIDDTLFRELDNLSENDLHATFIKFFTFMLLELNLPKKWIKQVSYFNTLLRYIIELPIPFNINKHINGKFRRVVKYQVTYTEARKLIDNDYPNIEGITYNLVVTNIKGKV